MSEVNSKRLLRVHSVPSSGPNSGDLGENQAPLRALGGPPKHNPCAGCQGARELGKRVGSITAGLSASCSPRNASLTVVRGPVISKHPLCGVLDEM